MKRIFWLMFNITTLPILVFVELFNIKMLAARTERIGHLGFDTELYLRNEDNKSDLLVFGTKISNRQLVKMFKRETSYIILPTFLVDLLKSQRSWLNQSDHFIEVPKQSNITYDKPVINFTNAEIRKGEKYLRMMGISENDWFVCFHARDSLYLKKKFPKKDFSYHDIRDVKIETYFDAMNYITEKGGFVVRMGAIVEEPLQTDNPKIIDYATKYRSDFMDIYLASRCRFWVGDSCGLCYIPVLFNVPTIWANLINHSNKIKHGKSMSLYKKFENINISEIKQLGLHNTEKKGDFESKNIKVIDNTPQEILDLVIKMENMIK